LKLKVVALQSLIFTVEWGLMLVGFGLISVLIVPYPIFPESGSIYRFLNAGLKALFGLMLSLVWLFVWDRQVRTLLYPGRESGLNS
jgi:hypothetical protein